MVRRDPSLRTTPLIDRHEQLGAKIGPFAGYAMPIHYGGIADEHDAVRKRAGVFDVSHMGRLRFSGEEAERAVERLVTIHLPALKSGRARYGFVLNDDGGVIDDVILYRVADRDWLLVVNAGNREAVLSRAESLGVRRYLGDETESSGMLALQGPEARDVLRRAMPEVGLPEPSMRVTESTWSDAPLVVATTGYTGEDGVEVIASSDVIAPLWDAILAAGAAPAGLGARDTLRLEVGYPLHGHELTTDTTPWQAGLSFGVDERNTEFAGRERLMERRSDVTWKLVGMVATGKGIPRAMQVVLRGDDSVGSVTSGTYSPSLGTGIALAYVQGDASNAGRKLAVAPEATSRRRVEVEVVRTPFYRGGSRRSSGG